MTTRQYTDRWPRAFCGIGSGEAARRVAGVWRLWLLLLIPLLVLSACGIGLPKHSSTSVPTAMPLATPSLTSQASEMDLPFETIEQLEAADNGKYYEDKRPGLFVITNSDEAIELQGIINPAAQARIFQGWKATTRYGVQIERIARQGDKVTIYARFAEPKPEEERGAEITSPCQLVQVQKAGRWGQEITFRVIVNDTDVVSLSMMCPDVGMGWRLLFSGCRLLSITYSRHTGYCR